METTGAIIFKLPRPTVVKAITAESRTALRGLFVCPCPLANSRMNGTILSDARDCSTRGPPRNEAMAEDSAAAMTPAVIRKGKSAMRFIEP